MKRNEQQALLERLLGRLLVENRDLKVTVYDDVRIEHNHIVLMRIDDTSVRVDNIIHWFMNDHKAEDFSAQTFAEGDKPRNKWDENTKFYTLIFGERVEAAANLPLILDTGHCGHHHYGAVRYKGKKYTFEATVSDEPSLLGIGGGRVEKLTLLSDKSGKMVFHFGLSTDRASMQEIKAICQAMDCYYEHFAD